MMNARFVFESSVFKAPSSPESNAMRKLLKGLEDIGAKIRFNDFTEIVYFSFLDDLMTYRFGDDMKLQYQGTDNNYHTMPGMVGLAILAYMKDKLANQAALRHSRWG